VRFELAPIEAPVELRIHWDHQPATDIGVSLRGLPDSLRYSGQGVSHMTVALGSHEILIGSEDRVVERSIRIDDYEPKVVSVDMATGEGLVFKGCPPAVASYLRSDLRGAAQALKRDGQDDLSSVLLAQLHQAQGQTENAAEQLENAGRARQAADLRRSMSDFSHAARLYEDSGDLQEAAEMYRSAGCWTEGARVYTALEQWEDAAHAFEQADDTNGLIGALEAQGKFLRAATLATEMEDRARSIRLLQQVGPNDPDHSHASELLVLAFEQEGHLDLAARQLEHSLELLGDGESASQLELHLSELLEESDQWQPALGVLETLRDRDPTFPGVASRIEGLRKKLSESARSQRDTALDSTHGASASGDQARYEILEEIGRGGMGRVYRARDRRLGREVALKRMPPGLRDHPAAVALFQREAQAAARMNHPNIVTLYDADQEQGHLFITMELLEGLPLNALLERHGPFGPKQTVQLALLACAGLSYAHDQGIVHRDIKTSNIFITREKTLKIMDFGLAKMIEAVRDQDASVIAGTPFYMAPEQSAGMVVDGRTDLYGLGVMLYEMSTGRLPFSEGNVGEQHRTAPRPDPSAIVADYPLALAQLIQRLMAISPEDRPASASDAARDLSSCLDPSNPT
jgi:tetratricopeptide (TPR) repeat protein